jgi:hypothetical protein
MASHRPVDVSLEMGMSRDIAFDFKMKLLPSIEFASL